MAYNPTIAPATLYKRFMAEMFDERDFIHVPTVFQTLFTRGASKTSFYEDTLSVEIDIIKGNETLAQWVRRGQYAREKLDVDKMLIERFTGKAYDFPLIEEETPLAASQLFQRRPGENPYGSNDRKAKLRGLAADAHREHIRKILRRLEKTAADVILTGKQTVFGGDTYDWNRDANMAITGVDWATSSNDVLGDLESACDLIRQKGHLKADTALMAPQMFDEFVKNDAVQDYIGFRRAEQILVNMDASNSKYADLIEAGADYRGRVQLPNGYVLDILTYNDFYDPDGNGTDTAYLASDKVVVFASSARTERWFGPEERLPWMASDAALFTEIFGFAPGSGPMPGLVYNKNSVMNSRMFMADAIIDPDHKNVVIRTQCAPLLVTTHADAYAVITSA